VTSGRALRIVFALALGLLPTLASIGHAHFDADPYSLSAAGRGTPPVGASNGTCPICAHQVLREELALGATPQAPALLTLRRPQSGPRARQVALLSHALPASRAPPLSA